MTSSFYKHLYFEAMPYSSGDGQMLLAPSHELEATREQGCVMCGVHKFEVQDCQSFTCLAFVHDAFSIAAGHCRPVRFFRAPALCGELCAWCRTRGSLATTVTSQTYREISTAGDPSMASTPDSHQRVAAHSSAPCCMRTLQSCRMCGGMQRQQNMLLCACIRAPTLDMWLENPLSRK